MDEAVDCAKSVGPATIPTTARELTLIQTRDRFCMPVILRRFSFRKNLMFGRWDVRERAEIRLAFAGSRPRSEKVRLTTLAKATVVEKPDPRTDY